MTSDQERAIDAITFLHGGWARVQEFTDSASVRVETAGDQPDYRVHPDGRVLREEWIEGALRFPRSWSLEDWLLEVYDPT